MADHRPQDGKASIPELERLTRRVLELEQEAARLNGRGAPQTLPIGLEDSLPARQAERVR